MLITFDALKLAAVRAGRAMGSGRKAGDLVLPDAHYLAGFVTSSTGPFFRRSQSFEPHASTTLRHSALVHTHTTAADRSTGNKNGGCGAGYPVSSYWAELLSFRVV